VILENNDTLSFFGIVPIFQGSFLQVVYLAAGIFYLQLTRLFLAVDAI
jgi:hypothetical protein